MVDTVILHTPRSAERAGMIADALSDRATVLLNALAGQPKPSFGTQMTVVGIIVGEVAPGSHEANLIDIVKSEAKGFLIARPGQVPADFPRTRLIKADPNFSVVTRRVRAALEGAAPEEPSKKKRAKSGAQPPALSAPPAPPKAVRAAAAKTTADATSRAPTVNAQLVEIAPREAERPVAKTADVALPRVEVFDPSKARRARKTGFAVGVGLGVFIAVAIIVAYTQVRRAPVAPQPAPVTSPAIEPAAVAPPEAAPVDAAPTEATATDPASEPALRGLTEPQAPAAAASSPVQSAAPASPPATQPPAQSPPAQPTQAETAPAETVSDIPEPLPTLD